MVSKMQTISNSLWAETTFPKTILLVYGVSPTEDKLLFIPYLTNLLTSFSHINCESLTEHVTVYLLDQVKTDSFPECFIGLATTDNAKGNADSLR